MHTAAQQYIGIINDEIVCHTGIIFFPMRKGWKRVHRLVVLPDYQGIGIGTKFIKEIAKIVNKDGYELNLTTTTPSLIHALKKDKDWELIRYGRVKGKMDFSRYGGDYARETKKLDNANSGKRITYSFNYKRNNK